MAYHSTEDLGSHRDVNWIIKCDCGLFEIVERRWLRGNKAPKYHECSKCREMRWGDSKPPVYDHWRRLMRNVDLDEQLEDFAFFRACFEHSYIELKAEYYGESENLKLVKRNKRKKHSLENSAWGLVSDVQRQVLRLYRQGLSEKEIAYDMDRTPNNIHKHLQNLGLIPKLSKAEWRLKLRDPEHMRKVSHARFK